MVRESSILLSCILQILKNLLTQARTIICVKSIKCMIDMGWDICIGKVAHIDYFQYKRGKLALLNKKDNHHSNSVVKLNIEEHADIKWLMIYCDVKNRASSLMYFCQKYQFESIKPLKPTSFLHDTLVSKLKRTRQNRRWVTVRTSSSMSSSQCVTKWGLC